MDLQVVGKTARIRFVALSRFPIIAGMPAGVPAFSRLRSAAQRCILRRDIKSVDEVLC